MGADRRRRHGRDPPSWTERQLRRTARKLAAEDVDWTQDIIAIWVHRTVGNTITIGVCVWIAPFDDVVDAIDIVVCDDIVGAIDIVIVC